MITDKIQIQSYENPIEHILRERDKKNPDQQTVKYIDSRGGGIAQRVFGPIWSTIRTA